MDSDEGNAENATCMTIEIMRHIRKVSLRVCLFVRICA